MADEGAGARLPRGAASGAHTARTARGELQATVAGRPSPGPRHSLLRALPSPENYKATGPASVVTVLSRAKGCAQTPAQSGPGTVSCSPRSLLAPVLRTEARGGPSTSPPHLQPRKPGEAERFGPGTRLALGADGFGFSIRTMF